MAGVSVSKVFAAGVAGAVAYWAGKRALRARRYVNPRGKTVLITGGSRGLGLVLAREIAGAGASVAICARSKDELDRATDEFFHRDTPFLAVPCDVTDRAAVEKLVATVENHLGPIDILVNNAGTITVGPLETMTEEDFQESLALHFWAPYFTSRAVLPSMRRRGGGRIVNIASIGGKIPVPHLAPYCAGKFALVGLSGCMRAELARENIFVTTVCPGLMRTGSPRNALTKGKHAEEYRWFVVSDSLPGLSMAARRAARKIVDAAVHGDGEVVISLPAKMAAKGYALAPELVGRLLRMQNAMLPGVPEAGGGGERRAGRTVETGWTRSVLTGLTQRAARENNEVGAEGRPS